MDVSKFNVGDEVWAFAHRAWRKATIIGIGAVRVKATVITNIRTGRTVEKCFGGKADGGFPVYPGNLAAPETYHCSIRECPMAAVPWNGHPGVSESQLKAEHDRAWHSARTKEI